MPDSDSQIRIETSGTQPVALAVFPPVVLAVLNGGQAASVRDGIFQRFMASAVAPPPVAAQRTRIKPAALVDDKSLNAMNEESWKSAAVWHLAVPSDARGGKLLLRIHYVGDVARVYAGGKLIMDNFYNGEPFDVGYWRIPREARDTVEIRVMPLRADHLAYLPEDVRPSLSTSAGVAEVSQIECVRRTQATVVLKGDTKP